MIIDYFESKKIKAALHNVVRDTASDILSVYQPDESVFNPLVDAVVSALIKPLERLIQKQRINILLDSGNKEEIEKAKHKIQESIEIYKDNIATKRENLEHVPQTWVDRLQELEGYLRLLSPVYYIITDTEYYGHPQSLLTLVHPHDYGLVPIKVSRDTDLSRRKDQIRKRIEEKEKEYQEEYQAYQADMKKKKRKGSPHDLSYTLREKKDLIDSLYETESYLLKLDREKDSLDPRPDEKLTDTQESSLREDTQESSLREDAQESSLREDAQDQDTKPHIGDNSEKIRRVRRFKTYTKDELESSLSSHLALIKKHRLHGEDVPQSLTDSIAEIQDILNGIDPISKKSIMVSVDSFYESVDIGSIKTTIDRVNEITRSFGGYFQDWLQKTKPTYILAPAKAKTIDDKISKSSAALAKLHPRGLHGFDIENPTLRDLLSSELIQKIPAFLHHWLDQKNVFDISDRTPNPMPESIMDLAETCYYDFLKAHWTIEWIKDFTQKKPTEAEDLFRTAIVKAWLPLIMAPREKYLPPAPKRGDLYSKAEFENIQPLFWSKKGAFHVQWNPFIQLISMCQAMDQLAPYSYKHIVMRMIHRQIHLYDNYFLLVPVAPHYMTPSRFISDCVATRIQDEFTLTFNNFTRLYDDKKENQKRGYTWSDPAVDGRLEQADAPSTHEQNNREFLYFVALRTLNATTNLLFLAYHHKRIFDKYLLNSMYEAWFTLFPIDPYASSEEMKRRNNRFWEVIDDLYVHAISNGMNELVFVNLFASMASVLGIPSYLGTKMKILTNDHLYGGGREKDDSFVGKKYEINFIVERLKIVRQFSKLVSGIHDDYENQRGRQQRISFYDRFATPGSTFSLLDMDISAEPELLQSLLFFVMDTLYPRSNALLYARGIIQEYVRFLLSHYIKGSRPEELLNFTYQDIMDSPTHSIEKTWNYGNAHFYVRVAFDGEKAILQIGNDGDTWVSSGGDWIASPSYFSDSEYFIKSQYIDNNNQIRSEKLDKYAFWVINPTNSHGSTSIFYPRHLLEDINSEIKTALRNISKEIGKIESGDFDPESASESIARMLFYVRTGDRIGLGLNYAPPPDASYVRRLEIEQDNANDLSPFKGWMNYGPEYLQILKDQIYSILTRPPQSARTTNGR